MYCPGVSLPEKASVQRRVLWGGGSRRQQREGPNTSRQEGDTRPVREDQDSTSKIRAASLDNVNLIFKG